MAPPSSPTDATADSPAGTLRVVGAAEHNLRAVDVSLPLGQWIAVTGPSGSGKTTLVFDTIVAESERRFLATLSARARHYMGKAGGAAVERIDGLPVAVAVGQRAVSGHVRSTVGTLTGVMDLLRLLFARVAVDPEGVTLSRSHFSFNHPLGACEACQGLGLVDRVDPALLLADGRKSIRGGALVPTLKSGYTVYSQVTLEVMGQICEAHGFSVDTPWEALTDAQREVVLYGTKALKVPFGKHSIESRMRWEGITARPRQEGYYRGLIPVIEETLARSRNPGVLRFVRSTPCPTCEGTRLGRPGRQARHGGATLPSLLAAPVAGLTAGLDALPGHAVWDALRPSVVPQLQRMVRLGLGHLTLDRPSTTLSGGEAQRIRLAAQLAGGLSGMLVALDEPTLGLHPTRQGPMAEVLRELVEAGNSLLVVEHDPDMVRHADRVIAVGPGAGPDGGRIVADGPTPDDPLGPPPGPNPAPRPGEASITVRGATLHNLRDATLAIRTAAFNVVVGRSGAGKSSLVFGTLLPALTGATGGPYAELTGATPGKVRALDARPIGRTSRSTPATFSGLFDLIRARFAATEDARARGFSAGRFSYNNKEGRCPTCDGLGVQRIGLHLLADAEIRCATCHGQRYDAATLEVRWEGRTIADILALSVREATEIFADDPPIARLCRAMDALGLGYLQLGQSSASLSRGEAQRVKLATLLGKESEQPTLLLLDEPDRGLHPDDVARLLAALRRLTEAGHTVVAISHHRHVWAAADFVTELEDGVARPITVESLSRLSHSGAPRPVVAPPTEIALRGVGTHTLRDLDVALPHDALTVIAGVSGSGKTSLAFDTLTSEAWHRFAETLPFSVRRFVRRLPRPTLRSATGLRPTLAIRQGQARAPVRSTVATQSELSPLLRTLWSRAGTVDGQPCSWTAEHFSADRPLGACPTCEGLGEVSRCSPERLVTAPERALADGALGGTRPGRFFGEPDGQYIATLRAVYPDVDFETPWEALPDAVRHGVLYGVDRTVSVQWKFRRGSREGEHRFEGTWDGLCALVEREARRRAASKHAAQWAEPLVAGPCPACEGQRLRPEVAAVEVAGMTLPALMDRPLAEVREHLDGWLTATSGARAAVLAALVPPIRERVDDLCSLGLGHLSLARRSQTLSEGERSRTRLAGVLRSGLTGTTVVL
ncbi:MAG: AAA family ATPase, partial [Myxococcota bacterium]